MTSDLTRGYLLTQTITIMQNLKEISKSYKLGTPVYYIADGVIHTDVVVAQHKFEYAVEENSHPTQDIVNIGDITCTIEKSIIVVLAYSHRIYTTSRIYIPMDIKNNHKIRLISKLYLSKEALLSSIQIDINNSLNALTQTPV